MSAMNAIIGYIFCGAIIGGDIALLIYGFIQLINCIFQMLPTGIGGNFILEAWEFDMFTMAVTFSISFGAVIGGLYGISTIETPGEAKEKGMQRAAKFNRKALKVYEVCEKNSESVGTMTETTYISPKQMKSIMAELANIAELKGKVDAIVDDMKEGGASSDN